MYGLRAAIRWNDTATYAVAGSNVDGQISLNAPQAGKSVTFFVTSFHCAPLSLVFQSLPSLVPAQMRPGWIFEYSMLHTASPLYRPRLAPTIPPFRPTRAQCF